MCTEEANWREKRLFKLKAETWDEFCNKYVGFGRAYADRLIRQFEEFGPNYFHISQLMRISPSRYRAIAGSVGEDRIQFGGRTITIDAENSQRIVEAVNNLLIASGEGRQEPKRTARKQQSDAAETAPPTPKERMDRMREQMDRFAFEFSALVRERLNEPDRSYLSALIEESNKRLNLLIYSVPRPGSY